ncbi:MAG: sulfatase-like hydrolase/transferase [Candidatus Rifleibacteriota bacterium]
MQNRHSFLLFFQFIILNILIVFFSSAIFPVDFFALSVVIPFFNIEVALSLFFAALLIFSIIKKQFADKLIFVYLPAIFLLIFIFASVALNSMAFWFWGVLFFSAYFLWFWESVTCHYFPRLIFVYLPFNLFLSLFLYIDYKHYALTRQHIKSFYLRKIQSFGGSFFENLTNAGLTLNMVLIPLAAIALFIIVSFFIFKYGPKLKFTARNKICGAVFSLSFLFIYIQYFIFAAGIPFNEYFEFKIRNFWFPLPQYPMLANRNFDKIDNFLKNAKVKSADFNQQPEFGWTKKHKKKNFVFLVFESFRADMVANLMTRTKKLAEEGIWCANHLSNSNETEGGIIAIYYNTLPLASQRSYYDKNPAAWIEFLKKSGYDFLRLSHSYGNLFYPEYQYVSVKDYLKDKYELKPDELGVVKDSKLICDAIVDKLQKSDQCIIEGLLFHTHYKYWYPPEFEKYTPVLKQNREILTSDFKTVSNRLANRYRNSILYSDHLIEYFINQLKSKNLFSDTIVVITGDHGQALGENGVLFHSTSPDILQNRVPCIILGGGLPSVKVNKLTSHIDILPTLGHLADFKVKNSYGYNMLEDTNKGVATFDVSGKNRIVYRSDKNSSLYHFSELQGLKWGVTGNNQFIFDDNFQKQYQPENMEKTCNKILNHSKKLIEIIKKK